jgi:hypothetical protein
MGEGVSKKVGEALQVWSSDTLKTRQKLIKKLSKDNDAAGRGGQ